MKTFVWLLTLFVWVPVAATDKLVREPGSRDAAPAEVRSSAGDRDRPVRLRKPTVIDRSGRYRLVNDILHEGTVFTITASDVELDLGGHLVRALNDLQNPFYLIVVEEGVSRVTLHDGRIDANWPALRMDDTSHVTLTKLVIDGGLSSEGARDATIRDNSIGGFEAGLDLDCTRCSIVDNRLGTPSDDHVSLTDGTFERNIIVSGQLSVSGSRTFWRENKITADVFEYYANQSFFERNMLRVAGDGIELRAAAGNIIDSNTLLHTSSSADAALRFGADASNNLYRGNLAQGWETPVADAGSDNRSNGDNYLPGRF